MEVSQTTGLIEQVIAKDVILGGILVVILLAFIYNIYMAKIRSRDQARQYEAMAKREEMFMTIVNSNTAAINANTVVLQGVKAVVDSNTAAVGVLTTFCHAKIDNERNEEEHLKDIAKTHEGGG